MLCKHRFLFFHILQASLQSILFRLFLQIYVKDPFRMIHITCPVEVLRERERARGDRCSGSAEASAEYLYPRDGYDLTVDTGAKSPQENALSVFEKMFR